MTEPKLYWYYIEVECKWKPVDDIYTMRIPAKNEEEALSEIDDITEYFDWDVHPSETNVLSITREGEA